MIAEDITLIYPPGASVQLRYIGNIKVNGVEANGTSTDYSGLEANQAIQNYFAPSDVIDN